MKCRDCGHYETQHIPRFDMGGGMVDTPGCLGTPKEGDEMCYCDKFVSQVYGDEG